MAKPNPFLFGRIVTDDHFCARPRTIGRLIAHFRQGQNTAIIGPRRIGKSSLIHQAAKSVKTRRFVFTDFWGVHTIADFVRRCVQALDTLDDKTTLLKKITTALPGLTVTVGVDPLAGTPTLTPSLTSRSKPQPETVAQIVRLWASLAAEKKMIIALDEFQDVLAIEDGNQVLGIMRKEIQLLNRVSFCFCGSIRNEMWKIFAEDGGAFYKAASLLELGVDDFEDWQGFLQQRFQLSGLRIGGEELQEIHRIAGGNPGDSQQLCSSVCDLAKSEGIRKITQETVNKALLQVFADERKGYEHLVADVTGQQLAVLRTMAQLGGKTVQSSEFLEQAGITHASSSKAAATRLVNRRILQETTQGLEFSNPFFRAWLNHAGY